MRTLIAILVCCFLSGCYAHECTKGTTRCQLGDLQRCDCKKKITGMYFDGTCLEATRWHLVPGIVGCIDTPDGPRGSRESCALPAMPPHCDQGRPAICEPAANGQNLLFVDQYCLDPLSCRIEPGDVVGCGEPITTNQETTLILYATHPITLDDKEYWPPVLVPVDATVGMDSAGFVVFATGDQVQASRGGSVPLKAGNRVTLPRPLTATFMLYQKGAPEVIDSVVADAKLALEYQTFYSRPLPHLEAVVRASAVTFTGDRTTALRLIDQALVSTPENASLADDGMLWGVRESIDRFGATVSPREP